MGRGAPVAELILGDAPLDAPVHVRARALPLEFVPDDALGLHAAGAVVKVGELVRNLNVECGMSVA